MKYLFQLPILVLLISCGSASQEREEIAVLTCNIMSESRDIDAVLRIKEINLAREQLGEQRFLKTDNEIMESFKYKLCKELVLNDPEYNIKLAVKIEKIAEEKRLVELKIAEEKRLVELKIAEEKRLVEEASPNNVSLREGELFLQSNLSQNGVIEVEPGLQYLVLNNGDDGARKPRPSDKVTAHFHGTLLDGTVFWSSVDMNDPLIIKPSQLIPGCQKILPLMKLGDKWKVFIHPDMAYGVEGRSTIPSNSVLTFDIELLAIN